MDMSRAAPAEPVPLRVPPHNLEAEKGVLASILLNNDLMNGVLEILRPEDFYQGIHRTLFAAMVELYERGRAIDVLTLTAALKDRGSEGETAGLLPYLSDLVHDVPITAHAASYARLVKEKAILRRTIAVAQEIAASAFQGVPEIDDFLDRTEQAVLAIAEDKIKPSYFSMAEMAKESMREIERLFEKKELITGLSSGFKDLDQWTAGFQRSDLVIVAARPGMGKTALCLNFALNAALRQKVPVAIFSLEMSRQQLAFRMICSDARVDFKRLRTGYITQEEINRIVASVGRLSEAPIYTDDSGALTALELRAKARRLRKEKGIGLVIVDYLQLMRGGGTRSSSDNRVQEISEISRSLKALAKELDVPVIAISQLNRGVENRNDKRPQLADLRECVTGDTPVLMADGGRIPIRELSGRKARVLSMSGDGRIVTALTEAVWPVGLRPVLRLTLASGRILRATADHRVYGPAGWIKVGELAPGDRLAVARRLPGPAVGTVWDKERIVLLAHLIGDGSYLVHQPMRYTTSSEENSRAVSEAATKAFGAKVTRRPGRGKWHQLLISGNGNRWHPAGVNLWLRELGVFGQRSREKRIPQEAFRLPDDGIALLLRHLFATDGCIHGRRKGSKGSARIYFSTSSEGLARDVAALLLRMGIVARIRSSSKGYASPFYAVDVSGAPQQMLFLDAVGAFGPREEPARRIRRELEAVVPNPNVDTLPQEVFAEVKAAMAERGISQRAMADLRGTSYGGSSHFGFAPSRAVIGDYARLLGDDALRRWSENDLFWDRVADVREDGTEEVFDMTVPGPASWLADGLVSHNSGAIEQDADLILFVYREEMYAKAETPDNRKGVAEIIIGKQRNGPMGVSELVFLSQYTRFEDKARDFE